MASALSFTSCLTLLVLITCVYADNTLFTASFYRDINPAPTENITQVEVMNFYRRFKESPVSRCRFMSLLVGTYHFNSLKASVLFDVMQTSDGSNISQDEFVGAMMRSLSSQVTSYDSFMQRLDSISDNVDDLLDRPFELGEGPNRYFRNAFQVEDLANFFDADNDGEMTWEEITVGMRSLDRDDDWGISRCEFVDSMQRYRQHAVTSAKLFDTIFASRDIPWADVDSEFLGRMINRNKDRMITKSEFIWFFSLENEIASGVPIEAAESRFGFRDSAGSVGFNLGLLITATMLASLSM